MNPKQRNLLIGMIAVVVVMGLFPPFHYVGREGIVVNGGYNFVLSPPGTGVFRASVDTAMLVTQWIGVVIVGTISYLLLRENR